jgi:hypothetical protein
VAALENQINGLDNGTYELFMSIGLKVITNRIHY